MIAFSIHAKRHMTAKESQFSTAPLPRVCFAMTPRVELTLSQPPMELWSTRPEHKPFDLTTFRQRIYQEIRRTKFIHWCELKREQKEGERAERNSKRDHTLMQEA